MKVISLDTNEVIQKRFNGGVIKLNKYLFYTKFILNYLAIKHSQFCPQ